MGVVGTFIFLPQVVVHFFGDTLGVPVTLFLAGIGVIGVALAIPRLARR